MPAAFTFLSMEEFGRLSSHEKLDYLSDAMEELERIKVPREIRGWSTLFTQTRQQQPAQPGDDPPPPSD